MTGSDNFRAALLQRIRAFREAEGRVEDRFEEIARERDSARRRREAAESLFEAEFGEVPPLAAAVTPPPRKSTKAQSETAAPHQMVDGPLTGLHWQEAILKVLAEGGALHVREIWDRLAAGGFSTGARDPLRSIVAVSIRSPNIVKAGPNIYELVGDDRTHELRLDEDPDVGVTLKSMSRKETK